MAGPTFPTAICSTKPACLRRRFEPTATELSPAAHHDFGDGGAAVGGADLEAHVARGHRAEGGDLHPAVGRPGSRARLAEVAAVGAGENAVRGDVAVPAALLEVVARDVAEPADFGRGLRAAEVQGDGLRQRAGGLPHADELRVVLAVDRVVRV